MVNITGARAWVDLPAAKPRLGGLFPAATVIDTADPHVLLGVEGQTHACVAAEHWSGGNCGYGFPATPCNPGGTPTLKTFHGLTDVTGDPFTIYDGIDCNLLGSDGFGTHVRDGLTLKEAKAVETHVLTVMQSLAGAPNLSGDVVAKVAAAEGWLADNYEGQGVIHMSRSLAAEACAAQVVSVGLDGTLTTCQGTPIANGAGYSALSDSVIASGQVVLMRGPIESRDVPQMDNGDGTCSPPRSLAERTYVALIECGAAQFDTSP